MSNDTEDYRELLPPEITIQDVECLQSAIQALEYENYNETFIKPKRNLLNKLKLMVKKYL